MSKPSVGRKLAYLNERNPAFPRVGATTGNTNSRSPYGPTYASIAELNTAADSNYNSLQLKVNRRFNKGLTYTIAYTYSKAINEVLTDATFAEIGQPNNPQNPDDRRADRGRGDLDVPQRFVSSFLWDLPCRSTKGPAGWALGGWELGGIITLQDGDPFTIFTGRDASLTGVNKDRPNLLRGPTLPTHGEKLRRTSFCGTQGTASVPRRRRGFDR